MTNAGDNISKKRGGWSFEGTVADTFDDHVSKSVPGYTEGHKIVAGLADFFISDNSKVYEIGCSTGTLIHKLATECEGKKDINYIGLDVVDSMIKLAIEKHSSIKLHSDCSLEFEQADIMEYPLHKSSFIVCYYTVQFIHPSIRQQVIDKIYEALNWGGALVMFEKVRGADARFQDILTGLYHDYKMEVGYSPEEVVAKSQSLRGVMEPFSVKGNLDLLSRAGFQDIETVYRNICFQGFLAIK